MIDFRKYLEEKICGVISGYEDEDIYAIAFFVEANEAYQYNGYSNVTQFSVSYNTEKDCEYADGLSEVRWNYAFWRQNETYIIDPDNKNEGAKILFEWYKENGIENIGFEDFDLSYDSDMNYIGKGPIGYFELLSEIAAVAKKLQESGFIKNKFGHSIPIIIHDLEYPWYIIEANKIANPNGEADMFLAAMEEIFSC